MANPVDLLNGYMQSAVAALAAGDYATALNNALAAQGLIVVMPKASRGQGSGGGQQSVEWDASGIDSFVLRIRQQYGASLGVQTHPVLAIEPQVSGNGDEFAYGQGGYVQ